MGNALSNDEINQRLHEAAEQGNLRDIQKYLKQGGDLNRHIFHDNFQKPPSFKPEFQSEKGEAFDSLVSSLAQDNSIDGRSSVTTTGTLGKDLKMNALHRAASRKNNAKTLDYVLRHISDVDEQDSHGDSALHYVAMFRNNENSLATLLGFKPNINLQNDCGETPLYSAVVRGCDLKVVEWLLRSGANPDICNSNGDTPLHACAMRRGIDPLIPGILLRFGANPNLKNRLGQTPLHVSAETTNNAVLLLLKFNAKVRLRDNNGRRPSEVATNEDVRKVLLEEEKDLIERTIAIGDIVATQERHQIENSPSIRSDTTVQNWLNKQRSLNDQSDPCKGGGIILESNDVVIYPQRSKSLEHDRRLSQRDVKFSGGGGLGIIRFPGNKEIIVPPDAMPLGTMMEVSIESTDDSIHIPDLSSCNVKFDISINLSGRSNKQGDGTLQWPPVFTGMCLEGQTKWITARDVETRGNGDTHVKFVLLKEKSIPLTKRPPSIRITAPILSDEDGDVFVEDTPSHDSFHTERIPSENEQRITEKFCSRQITVYKETEASETSESRDGSDVESFTDEDYQIDSAYREADHAELIDARQENYRIHHPIDLELATITEEDQH